MPIFIFSVTDSDEDALATHAFSSLAAPTALPSSTLDFKRVCDGNKEDRAKGSIRAMEFHPTSTVMLTGGPDQTLRLFAVSPNTLFFCVWNLIF